MFTRLSNFTYGNYQIANITSTEVNVDTQLLIHIQKYEKEGLQLLLEEALYGEFMSNLELDSLYWKLKSSAAEKWGWLLNGKSYPDPLDASKTKNWKGIVCKVAKIQDVDIYESMLASFVFFYYSLNSRTLNTGAGESKMKVDNTTQESSSNKRADAWNDFVRWASHSFSESNVSLFQFLYDHRDLYGKDCFIELNTMIYDF